MLQTVSGTGARDAMNQRHQLARSNPGRVIIDSRLSLCYTEHVSGKEYHTVQLILI